MNSEQNNYFFVGTKFGDDDYLEYFRKEGKWELGWHNNEENKQYQKMLKLFNKIKPGDVLFAKTTYVKKKNLPFVKKDDLKVSVMNIRGMATVKEVLDDGHTIIVDWKKEYIEREWFFFTGQETIWFPSDIKYRTKETDQLIKFAASDEIIIQDYDYFLNHPNWKKYKKLESETMLRNDFLFNYSGILKKSKNLILRGAPGTGKTYLAKEIAMELTGGNEEQIGFVQFHPSYDYTDFVEGLRPVSNGDGAIEFKLQDGIFKQFCQRAKEAQKTGGQDNFEEAWDLYLEYVNSRDEKEYLTEFSYLTVNSRNNFNINYETKSQGTCLTKSYVYELYKDEKYLKQPYYRNQGKKVLEILKKRFGLKDYISPTEINTDKNFVFIIDEINRGEISKIFGELFFSIDPGYRGEKGCVSTQYANLHETDEKFYIPENVYIIGTMNDIDRSVDTFDFAMRRRFRFVEVTAESQLYILDNELDGHEEEAKKRLRNLNAAIENVQELNSHYHIGPSYFRNLKELDYDYELLWSDYLKPLLEDYLRGSYEEAETLGTLKKAFDLTKNEQKNQAVADDHEGDEDDDADN
ncbi:AAA domain-containing protein [Streptococcus mitis]|uniref:AAA domain-containing protein n=1 Tax=Streptococcus mitis TaxID=28037 RepID=A0A6I1UL04_STRMT|nr:AAA family ATPase [Streptococcus mitis]MBS5367146.1 AAA family ATPase [Streptococcus mitis]MQP83560.1 AAA domain-containing protein [Streptococcus mitis]MQQ41404.1 AAA domain-containing protein [Streptococcus mitis]MQQ62463.1 AAA domain-containing protein [Streptococcus mitis]